VNVLTIRFLERFWIHPVKRAGKRRRPDGCHRTKP
jgi:hypothetical protein